MHRGVRHCGHKCRLDEKAFEVVLVSRAVTREAIPQILRIRVARDGQRVAEVPTREVQDEVVQRQRNLTGTGETPVAPDYPMFPTK